MKNTSITPRTRCGQQGYALMVVIFFVALMTIAVAAAAPSIITSVKREREQEMIWRGKQYVRGIRLYYRKAHRFPTDLEDLYKPKTGIRIMRQPYKDPMNTVDGTWRMIYVGPNGMLIGSLKDRTVNLAGQSMGGFGGAAGGSLNSNGAAGSSVFGSSNGFGSASSFGSNNISATNSPANQTATAAQANSAATGQTAAEGDTSPQPAPLSTGPVFGGNIIGVGSKVNSKSVIWFETAKNYQQYEFVWDPSVNPLTGSRAVINTGAGNPFGAPGGSTPGSPFSNGSNPNPTPNPPQNAPGNPDPPLQAPPN